MAVLIIVGTLFIASSVWYVTATMRDKTNCSCSKEKSGTMPNGH
jgi:hypothetical protein